MLKAAFKTSLPIINIFVVLKDERNLHNFDIKFAKHNCSGGTNLLPFF